ncbi:hypothetical protein H0E87_013234 [Populus deltoides]|uniref:Phospholipase D n=1 Tax=Populus deltoides TaxID=3696 RepID=A0A8T2YMT0_POPDE|nr:hypothetical protein H0E87_013234 [Populus deltoides]
MILGELLKKKDNEGVRVLMLVWDDRTSVKLLKKEGLMSAHDEDTITQNSIVELRIKRRIVSFIGDIDLCDGRYDTPYHSIFRTLDTVHHNDFLQPNFAGPSIDIGGARQRLHDIHCRLEGCLGCLCQCRAEVKKAR